MDYPQHCDDAVSVGGRSKYTFNAFGDEVYENQGFELKLTFDYDADACNTGDFDISSATGALTVAPYGDAGYSPVNLGGSPALSDSGGGTTDTITFSVPAGALPTDISENYAVSAQGNAVFTVTLTQGTKVLTFTQRTNLVDPYKGLTSTTTPSGISTQRNDLGNVINMTTSTPPVSPSYGDSYIVLATGTGAWAGYDNYLTVYNGSQWLFTLPVEGNYVYDNNSNLRYEYDGSAWAVAALKNIVEDTTPQLGGTLDSNGNDIDMATDHIRGATVLNLADGADPTKISAHDFSAITTATTRTVTYPDADVNLGNLATGAGSSTDNAVARFDSTTGKLLQNSVVLISDAGAVTGVTTLTASGNIISQNKLVVQKTTDSGDIDLYRLTGSTVTEGQAISIVRAYGYDSTGYQDGAYLQFTGRGTWTASSLPTSFDIYNTASGSTTPTLNFRIDQDGTADFQSNDLVNVAGVLATSGSNISITLGDAIGANKFSFYDSSFSELFSIASNGTANFQSNPITGVTTLGLSSDFTMENNTIFYIKDSGGTARNVFRLDNTNVLQIGNNALGVGGAVDFYNGAGYTKTVGISSTGAVTGVTTLTTSGAIDTTNGALTIRSTSAQGVANFVRNTGVTAVSGDLIAGLQGLAYDSSANQIGAQIFARARGTWSGTSRPTSWDFYTTASGSTTQTLNLRIDEDGTADFQGNNASNIGTVTINDFLNIPLKGELTIATGAITVTASNHTVDTESDASTDDLDTISGGSDGDILILRPANDARTIVVKHNTGNLRLDGSTDFSMDSANDRIILQYNGSVWCEISRSNNGA